MSPSFISGDTLFLQLSGSRFIGINSPTFYTSKIEVLYYETVPVYVSIITNYQG